VRACGSTRRGPGPRYGRERGAWSPPEAVLEKAVLEKAVLEKSSPPPSEEAGVER
jgi:hypothetical protein